MPVPVATRDLASFELWERSLERSRHRRVLAEAARKQLARRKTASVAMSAAVATAPMAPGIAAAANLSREGAAKLAQKLERRHVDRVLLERGDSSSAVIELQRALGIPHDGIYGPQTQAAVEALQQREGLPQTGDVDVRTWLKLFPTDAVVYVAPAAAKALGADTGNGPAWTAVKASDVGAAQMPLASTPSADGAGASHQSHHGASIAHAAAALPKHAGKPGHEQPTGGDASGPIGSLPGGPAPAAGTHGPGGPGPVPQVNPAPQVSPAPQGGPAPQPVPFAPPSVPTGSAGDIIRELIGAASRIDSRHFAYRWGGGHNSAFGGPYDCSGAVSAVLHAAGLVSRPMVSGDFMHWGAPGRGAVTIYANAGHVYMSILGRFFGTSSANPGGGAGWFRGGPRPGFAVVHVPFERLHLKARSAAKQRSRVMARRALHHRGRSTGGTAAGGGTPAVSTPAGATTQSGAPAQAPASVAPTQASPAPQTAPVAGQQPPVQVPGPADAVQQTPPQAPVAAPAPVQGPANSGTAPAAGSPQAAAGAPPASAAPAPADAAPQGAAQPEASGPAPTTAPAAPVQPAGTPATAEPAQPAEPATPPPAAAPAAAQEPASAAPADAPAATDAGAGEAPAGATTTGSG
jgi:hypothetical protein